jgi:hypothetical protein
VRDIGIYDLDYTARSVSCVANMFQQDISTKFAEISSFVPFM